MRSSHRHHGRHRSGWHHHHPEHPESADPAEEARDAGGLEEAEDAEEIEAEEIEEAEAEGKGRRRSRHRGGDHSRGGLGWTVVVALVVVVQAAVHGTLQLSGWRLPGWAQMGITLAVVTMVCSAWEWRRLRRQR